MKTQISRLKALWQRELTFLLCAIVNSAATVSIWTYLWLPTPEMAIERVASRVRAGGHNIPRDTIVRRYEAGRRNFSELYRPLADTWQVFDNSVTPQNIVANGGRNLETTIYNAVAWTNITEL